MSSFSFELGEPGMTGVGEAQGIREPLFLLRLQEWEALPEVRLVLGREVARLVKELHFDGQIRDAVLAPGQRRQGSGDCRMAPVDPVIAVSAIQHELNAPGSVGAGATPDVMDRVGETLSRLPGTQA